ncbi:LysR family transcriptional regulator [Streptomyces spirodelae]|uniref:LysR family transcriptional regulator n=1 Tax=Streptomyces spirodelae TaxID=2812904 RepID=A0ABS3WLV6_9ACTN|nr:LysR family transcriptional regulator [Streptomyces spirodelae]MBO8184095.1 LysR family transcriptional regulator [Streptomyces spirodelae]
MTIELRHLRAFLAIAEEGTITRAAARLHIGQPALSRTLRQLESHLGVRLVDRSTHHLELTTAGRRFREKATAALAAVDAALDPRPLTALPLRLGHPWAALGGRTIPLLRRWDEEHPEVPLELRRIDDRTAGLAQGKVDVALLRGEVRAPGLVTELLRHEERIAVVPADSELASRSALALADLAAWPVALNTVAGTTTPELWPASARPRETIEVTNTDEWLTAIAVGRAVGVSTSATPGLHSHPSIAYRPLTDAPPVPLLLAWRSGTPTHPAIPALVALARQLVAED